MLFKILIVVVTIVAVAFAFRAWGRKDGAIARRDEPPAPAQRPASKAEETLRCRQCDAFVPIGAKAACARADCPFR